MLDKDGQPSTNINYHHNVEKALDALFGVLSGIVADRSINEQEAVLLDAWLRENESLHDDPDVFDIMDATKDILSDGLVSADELKDLKGVVDTVLEYRLDLFPDQRQMTNHLLGLARGLTADSQLNDKEIKTLHRWLKKAWPLHSRWPANILIPRLREVLADGVVTETERTDLLALLDELNGGSMLETGVATGMTIGLPFDAAVRVDFNGHKFCPTGKFIYGPRAKVERAIIERGGSVSVTPTVKTNYLIVGSLASRDWAMTSYGRKIEAAMTLKGSGSNIVIVSEEIFVSSLG